MRKQANINRLNETADSMASRRSTLFFPNAAPKPVALTLRRIATGERSIPQSEIADILRYIADRIIPEIPPVDG